MSNTVRQKNNRGAALLLFVVLFLAASILLVLAVSRGAYDDIVAYRMLESSKTSFYGVEAGIEDAIFRHKHGDNYSAFEFFSIGATDVSVTRTALTDSFEFFFEAEHARAVRRGEMTLTLGSGTSFNFGLQAGNGGISLSNNSNIYGNVFSNATVAGQGVATVFGEIVAAGPGGRVETIHATGSVWAHHLNGADIDGDAYYFATSTRVATIVDGASYPGSPDQATTSLPISDELIEDWKEGIELTGSVIGSTSPECVSGVYVIDTDTTLGNVKIDCSVQVKKQGGGTTLTITNPIWISGNLFFDAGPTIVADSSLGRRSVQIIVDNESNRTTSSQISVNQSTVFSSGTSSSYVLLLSMNNSAENGGTQKAINLAQSASGQVLVYAGHGLVDMGNSISLREVTAYQIEVSNGASVTYESGLMSLLFTTGPGGGYTITEWREVE